jgi:hypothetical protein
MEPHGGFPAAVRQGQGTGELNLMKRSAAVAYLAVMMAACSDDSTGPEAGPHAVQVRVLATAEAAATGVSWRLLDAAGATVAGGKVDAGVADSVSVSLAPGRYRIEWPDTIVRVGSIFYRVAPKAESVTIGDGTSRVSAERSIAALTGALVVRMSVAGPPGIVVSPPQFNLTYMDSAGGKMFAFAAPTFVRDLLPPASYTTYWARSRNITYNGATYTIGVVDTMATTPVKASLIPSVLQVEYKVLMAPYRFRVLDAPAASLGSGSTSVRWTNPDGTAGSALCTLNGGDSGFCPLLPTGTPLTFSFAVLVATGPFDFSQQYAPTPAGATITLPASLEEPPLLTVRYTKVSAP